MKNITTNIRIALIAIAILGASRIAQAYTPSQPLDIRVSISASKSLAVSTTYYNFGALAINSTNVSASSITVTNDSGGLIETYTIQGASATAVTAGTDWGLAASTGTNQYAMDAQFSNPGSIQTAWTSDALSFTATPCTAEVFGNTSGSESGLNVSPSGVRGLWFRIKTPSAVTDTAEHKATITLAVQ